MEADAKANPIMTSPTAPNSSSNNGGTTHTSLFGSPIHIPGRGPTDPVPARQLSAMEKSRPAEAPIYANDGLLTSAHQTRSIMSAMPNVFQSDIQQLNLGDHMTRYRHLSRHPQTNTKTKRKQTNTTTATDSAAAAPAPASTDSGSASSAAGSIQ